MPTESLRIEGKAAGRQFRAADLWLKEDTEPLQVSEEQIPDSRSTPLDRSILQLRGSNRRPFPFPAILLGQQGRILEHARAELLEQRVTIEAEFVDVRNLLETTRATRHTKRLFVVHVASPDELPQLKRLSDTHLGQPILVLVNHGIDADFVIRIMRAGAAQVVTLPLQTAELGETLSHIALHFDNSTTKATVVAVTGVTGGCGTTTIAINLAYEIAHLQQLRTVLVELAVQRGMVATYLDVEPSYTTFDLLRDMEHVDSYVLEQALTPIADNFEILPGQYQALAPFKSTADDIRQLIDYTRAVSGVTVLDVPGTCDDLHFETLATADHVVLVGEQKVPSLRSMRVLHELIGREFGDRPQYLVLNRFEPRLEGFETERLRELLQVPQLHTIANDYAGVNAAGNHGRPLRLEAPNSRALADLDRLARALLSLPEPAAAPVHTPPLFRRLLRTLCLC